MLYAILILCFLITDQITKFLTVKYLTEFESYTVIEKVLQFTHVHNTGGPWSIFNGVPAIFVVMTIIIFIAGFAYFKAHPPKHMLEKTAVCMIAGGALGNFVDRILRGYVVDMIDVNLFDYPVFNVADCYIVIGAILMCVYIIFFDNNKEKK